MDPDDLRTSPVPAAPTEPPRQGRSGRRQPRGAATSENVDDRPAASDAPGAQQPAPDTTAPEPAAQSAANKTKADSEARALYAPADLELVAAATNNQAAASQRLPRRGFFSDLPDRGLFIFFLTLGTASVLFLKLGPIEPETAKWFATAAAAATLLVYALLGWRLKDIRLPGDRLGDNCYYLGFLLTLASMAAALLQFDLQDGDRGALLGQLIGSFGIALLSTFLGIALRVIFLQLRREVDDLEQTLRQDLQQHADALKGQLLFAVTELESFRLRTRQVMDERLIEVTDLFAQRSKAQLEQVIELAQQVASEGSRVLGEHTRQAMALEEAIRAQTRAAADLAERLGRIEVPPDLFRQEIRELTDRIATAAAPLEQSAGAFASRLDRIELPPDLLRQEIRQLTDRMATAAAPLEQAAGAFAGRIGQIDVPTDWVAHRLVPFTAALERATAAVERLSQAEIVRRTALDEAAARATAAIEQASRELQARPQGFFGRSAYALGWQRTRR